MEFVKLIIDLKDEVGVKRRDIKEKSSGFGGVVNNFLINLYLRKKGLKLKDELRSGFAIRDGNGEEIFLGGV